MATRTKSRQQDEQSQPVAAPPQKLDDQTPLDDIRRKKEELPEGYKKRLPGGVERKVSIVKKRVGKTKAKVYRVESDGVVKDYDRLKIEGESEMVHETDTSGCGLPGRIYIKTEAPLAVGNERPYNPDENEADPESVSFEVKVEFGQ